MPGVVKISEAASIAIHAMVALAVQPGKKISARKMAQQFELSSAHLSKVMQRLAKAGLVTSSRGPSGGFGLARSAQEISLLEIYEVVEGRLDAEGCLLSKSICPGGSCLLGDVIDEVNSTVRQTLADKTLAQLARSFLLRH